MQALGRPAGRCQIPHKRAIREFEALVTAPDPVRQFLQAGGTAIRQDLQDSQLPRRQDPAAGAAELPEQRSGEFPEQGAPVVDGDGRGDCVAPLGDRPEGESEEGSQVVSLAPGGEQRRQILSV